MTEVIRSVFDVVNTVWKSAKLDIDDPATVHVWDVALNDLATATVLAGCEALARDESRWPPTPGRFRRMCFDAADFQKRRAAAESPPVLPGVPAVSMHDAALNFCRARFLARMHPGLRAASNLATLVDRVASAPAYAVPAGPDWEYVVQMAPLPRSRSFDDHRAAFDDLREIFEREWSRSQGATA